MTHEQEQAFIADQLARAIEGDAWHGPSVTEAMDMLDAARGCRAPDDSAHSACEIVLHIASWLEIVRERMRGTEVSPTSAQDWPAAKGSPDVAWGGARRRLLAAHASLQSAVDAITPGELQAVVPGKSYDVRFMLHGVVQHTIYHAGQVAQLGRLTQHAL